MNNDLVKAVVSGLVTGGMSAATTFLTVFRSLTNRVRNVEELLGSSVEPKSGLFLSVATLEDALRRFKREIDSWEDAPPDWAKRMVNRAKLSSSTDLNTVVDIESRVDARLRSFQERLATLEQEHTTACCVTREEFLEDSKQRAAELAQLREQIATVNGLLKGVLVALGRDAERN